MNADAQELAVLASRTAEDCLVALGSSEEGIPSEESDLRRLKYGFNIPLSEVPKHWLSQLLRSFLSPFNGILTGVAVLSMMLNVLLPEYGHRDYSTILVVLFMVVLSALLRFVQEQRSARAAEKLRSLVRSTSQVMRPGGLSQEMDMSLLVRGDVISLAAGDMIPADCRLIRAHDLFISQSVLTGESLPVEKHAQVAVMPAGGVLTDIPNLCFQGTNVVSGTATAVVVATGVRTWFGSVHRIRDGAAPVSGFESGIARVTVILVRFVAVMVPLVFLINGITKGDWLAALLFSVSVAVGLTPEMLPVILTTNLARGAIEMGQRKVIVRRLPAIQSLGAMDVLCTDKTGTLTLDRIVLRRHLNVSGDEDLEVLKWAYLNSRFQTGLRSVIDRAILDHPTGEESERLHQVLDMSGRWSKADEIPFDFNRRRMSVLLRRPDGPFLLVCKGAVEEMLDVCTHAFDPGPDRQLHEEQDAIVPLTAALRAEALALTQRLSADGLRVMAVAIRTYPSQPPSMQVADECDMVLTGFIGFLDPPKPSSGPAVRALSGLGIRIKVLSGDHPVVTRKICREVGIDDSELLLGSDIDQMDDAGLMAAAAKATVMARLNPGQKARVVAALRRSGDTVGFLGDGINDAPAMRAADVGISVESAADIARESADLILLEKDLLVLRDGVVEGRRTFGNILKYIRMTTSSNFGNMLSVVVVSAALPFLPMLPVQLLVQNLLYDWSQAFTPWDRMDEDFIRKPVRWNTNGVSRFMLVMGPVSSVFDIATFLFLWFGLHARTPSAFQSGWFVEGLLSQALIVHLVRTSRVPFLESRASVPMLMATFSIMALGIWLPFSPFASMLGMQPLPALYFPWLAVILIGYFLVVQIVRRIYTRIYGSWL